MWRQYNSFIHSWWFFSFGWSSGFFLLVFGWRFCMQKMTYVKLGSIKNIFKSKRKMEKKVTIPAFQLNESWPAKTKKRKRKKFCIFEYPKRTNENDKMMKTKQKKTMFDHSSEHTIHISLSSFFHWWSNLDPNNHYYYCSGSIQKLWSKYICFYDHFISFMMMIVQFFCFIFHPEHYYHHQLNEYWILDMHVCMYVHISFVVNCKGKTFFLLTFFYILSLEICIWWWCTIYICAAIYFKIVVSRISGIKMIWSPTTKKKWRNFVNWSDFSCFFFEKFRETKFWLFSS